MSVLALAAAAAASATCAEPNVNSAALGHIFLAKRPDQELIANSGAGGKVIGYTRLRLEFQPCGADQRKYNDERRAWFRRALAGKSASKVLGLSARITPLDVTRWASLARFERASDGKGEQWDTSIENDRVLTPYFRIDQSSTVDLNFDLVSTRDYDISLSKDAFAIIEKAAALLAPSTQLITPGSKERFNKTASFVDSSVSGLLHVSIKEKLRQVSSLQASEDGGRLELASVIFHAPWANDALPPRKGRDASALSAPKPIGKWVVVAEPVRQSLFGAPSNGRLPITGLSAANILNFQINEDKSLRSHLADATGVNAARDALIKASEKQAPAEVLCRAVMAEADRLWFTPADAGAVAWAYIKSLSLEPKKGVELCATVENYPTGSEPAS